MNDENTFFKPDDRVMYSSPDEDDERYGKVTAVLRCDSIVVEWEDGEISTVSENFLDLV